MASLESVKVDVRVTCIARCNQQDLSSQIQIAVRPNWPEPNRRLTLESKDVEKLKTWFLDTFPDTYQISTSFPKSSYRFEVATSGTNGSVLDLKISPILRGGNSGPTVFNYHVEVIN